MPNDEREMERNADREASEIPDTEHEIERSADREVSETPTDEYEGEPEDAEQEVKLESILQALSKGPALPIELAVQTFSFPEEIAKPLASLEQEGLIERQALRTGEMIVLTQKGHERIKGAFS